MMKELEPPHMKCTSVGGVATCIELSPWKLALDMGVCPDSAVRLRRVLFSHTHCDHMAAIIQHCARRAMNGMEPPEYWVHAEELPKVEAMLAAWDDLNRGGLPRVLRGVSPGDRVALDSNRFVSVFASYHRIPALGYALHSQKRKLREEWKGRTGEEIRKAREAGEEVAILDETVEIAYCGDSTIDVLQHEQVRTARILLMEATFLDERVSIAKSKEGGHTHLDEIVANAASLQNEAIVFLHISRRFRQESALTILRERLPMELRERAHVVLFDRESRENRLFSLV